MLAIYHPLPDDDPNQTAEIDKEVGVQVSGPFEGAGRLLSAATPQGYIVHTMHIGYCHKLSDAHHAVKLFCEQNGRAILGVRREVYGHASPDESQSRTDVLYSLK